VNLQEIKDDILRKGFYKKILVVVVGAFLMAFNYNLMLLPNHFVVGGTSGLSLIFESLFGFDPHLFLYLSAFVLLILSFIFLGLKETLISALGSLLYPLFVSFTYPLASYASEFISTDNVLIAILVAGIVHGISYGVVYKVGFDTGGSDIVVKIVHKYAKISKGTATLIVQAFVLGLGAFVFGFNQFIYSFLVLLIYTAVMDKIIIGISDSKLFFIHTKKNNEVKKFILDELHSGVTVLETEGGYSHEKSEVLMCVVPNKDYYLFKEMILQIDKNAFFIINDCYEVQNGVKQDRTFF